MLQNFKDGVKDWFDPNSEENKNYFKNQMYRLKIIGWIFVLSPFLLFLLIVVMEVEEQFNITGLLFIPLHLSNYRLKIDLQNNLFNLYENTKLCERTYSLLPFRILRSFHRTNNLINDFSPDIVIGTGGYASALPLLVASTNKKNIPIILQEQNSFPGITTKWFAKRAAKICVAFKYKKSKLSGNIVYTGNPIRKDLSKGNKSLGYKNFYFNKNCKTIFLFGGSQGSSYLNNILSQTVKDFENANIQVIWQTGDNEYGKYKNYLSKKIHVTPFIDNMSEAYAISDLIICRSGALTISELTVCGKPAILIPFSHSAGDHQTKNAEVLVDSNAAKLISEKKLTKKNLFYTAMNLIHNEKALNEMRKASKAIGRPNATSKIVDYVLEKRL